MNEAENTPETNEQIMREYECAYLFVPTIAEEKLPASLDALKQTLVKHGAEIANEKPPQRIPLAYEMVVSERGKNKRYLEGYFGWVTMEAASESVQEIEQELRSNSELIRFILIKAPKDQDPFPKEDSEFEEDGEVQEAGEEALVSPQSEDEQKKQAADVSTEEIDKSIDKLVTQDKQE